MPWTMQMHMMEAGSPSGCSSTQHGDRDAPIACNPPAHSKGAVHLVGHGLARNRTYDDPAGLPALLRG